MNNMEKNESGREGLPIETVEKLMREIVGVPRETWSWRILGRGVPVLWSSGV